MTAKGKITTSRLEPGHRILVVPIDRPSGIYSHANPLRKTGSLIARVESVSGSINGRRDVLVRIGVEDGLIHGAGHETWWLAPELPHYTYVCSCGAPATWLLRRRLSDEANTSGDPMYATCTDHLDRSLSAITPARGTGYTYRITQDPNGLAL